MSVLGGAPLLSGVGFLGGDMILYLRIRHNTRCLETWNPGPRLWEKGAQRQGGLFEQGDQDQ